MTLVENLADKQAEMLVRSQKKRRRQNRINASGPRKKDIKTRPPRRSWESILKEQMLKANPREYCFLEWVRQQRDRNLPFGTFQEFYKYKDGEYPTDNPSLRDFKIQEPSIETTVTDEGNQATESLP